MRLRQAEAGAGAPHTGVMTPTGYAQHRFNVVPTCLDDLDGPVHGELELPKHLG